MSEVDIKNVAIVSKLKELFLVKADLQCHNSNDRHLTIILRNRAEYRLILRLKSDDIPRD